MSIELRAMIAGPASVCALLAAGVAARAEITPMTRQRTPQAVQVGRQAVNDHNPILYLDMCRTYAPYTAHMFEVTITTPFMAVAEAAFDAARDGKPIDPALMPFDSPEQQRVIVAVDPAELKPGLPASVARV
ncbi:MAG TPA: hypothetical protein VFE84_14005, partial [Patescibacteria group bacterium]|nr:hypothetical protein [Patescibacteria group bacterium]